MCVSSVGDTVTGRIGDYKRRACQVAGTEGRRDSGDTSSARRRRLLKPQVPIVPLLHPDRTDVLVAGSLVVVVHHPYDDIVRYYCSAFIQRNYLDVVGAVFGQFGRRQVPQDFFTGMGFTIRADRDEIGRKRARVEVAITFFLGVRQLVLKRDQLLCKRAQGLLLAVRTMNCRETEVLKCEERCAEHRRQKADRKSRFHTALRKPYRLTLANAPAAILK